MCSSSVIFSCAAPVDKLLFLLARAEARQTEAAILVSSEAGILRWWSVFGRKPELGEQNIGGNHTNISASLMSVYDQVCKHINSLIVAEMNIIIIISLIDS